MPPLATVEKSPGATLTYSIDWSGWLGESGDTISTYVWTVPSGLTSVLESNTTTEVSIKLSGGTQGKSYELKCAITTVAGLIDERTLKFTIEQR